MGSFNEIISSNSLVLVDFFATWCQPCKMLHPVLEQLKQGYADTLSIIKIDIDRNEEAADKLNVRSVPTLILYKNGEIVWRQSGAMPLSALKEVVERYK